MRYELKTPYRDSSTHVIFEPLDFIARLGGVSTRRVRRMLANGELPKVKVRGTALDRVRDLLGHTSVATTEIYAHLAPENVREAVNTLASTSHFRHSDDSRYQQINVSR